MIGLVESFGLPYALVTESDLLDPRCLRRFHHIILPMADFLPVIVGDKTATRLARDSRVVPLPLQDRPVTRSAFREMLRQHQIPFRLNFDSDKILAGRIGNLIYNWGDQPLQVTLPEKKTDAALEPYGFLFLEKR